MFFICMSQDVPKCRSYHRVSTRGQHKNQRLAVGARAVKGPHIPMSFRSHDPHNGHDSWNEIWASALLQVKPWRLQKALAQIGCYHLFRQQASDSFDVFLIVFFTGFCSMGLLQACYGVVSTNLGYCHWGYCNAIVFQFMHSTVG